jgi:hypothetical protein
MLVRPFVFSVPVPRPLASLLVGCWFSLFFTTCFGLHGHFQVCRIFYFYMLEGFCFAAKQQRQQQADKHAQGNNKNNEGKQKKNTNGNMQSVTT